MLKVFRCWAENHRHFVTNSSTGLSKLLSRCTWEQVEQKNFPMKTLHFLVPTLSGKFHFCPKVFWLGCQNCIPPGNRIILRRSILFELFLYLFRTLSKKSSGFCRIFINWIVKTAFFASRSVFCVEHLLQEICRVVYQFRTFRQKHLLSGRKITPYLSKVHSDCPLEKFEERFSLEILFGRFERSSKKQFRFFLE